jgi:hypothetical protein
MKSRVLLAAFLAMAGCARAPAPPTPPPPQAGVTLEVFDDALAMHGEWIVVARYGRVWRPLHVGVGWQPYLYGEWVWTADGWFWLTDEPWGWATYHYGRWAWDPALGWFWVPGFVWAPAWVAWRVGDGFVGWAPLYPEFTVWWVDAYPLVPPHWIFVPMSSFVAVQIESSPCRAPAYLRSSARAARRRPRACAVRRRRRGSAALRGRSGVRDARSPARVVAAAPADPGADRPARAVIAPHRAPRRSVPRRTTESTCRVRSRNGGSGAEAHPPPRRRPGQSGSAYQRPARKTEEEGKHSAPARPTSPRNSTPTDETPTSAAELIRSVPDLTARRGSGSRAPHPAPAGARLDVRSVAHSSEAPHPSRRFSGAGSLRCTRTKPELVSRGGPS